MMSPAELNVLDSARCPGCGFHRPTQGCECNGTLKFARALKAQGQARATAAHPSDRARVEAVIRQLAATGRPFSANDARAIHGVTGGVVGATFTAMRAEGVIEQTGYERSTKASTHAHPVATWRAATKNNPASAVQG